MEQPFKTISTIYYLEKSKLYEITYYRVALKLEGLMKKYEERLKTNTNSVLSIPDGISAKNSLRDKLTREIQGIRTFSNDFNDLDKIDPEDIKRLTKEVKHRLGYKN